MELTTYQPPEIYDSSGVKIRAGTFGPNTPFYDDRGHGVYDYLVNNMEHIQNSVGGAAASASTATAQAAVAEAKANEALSAKTAALQAKVDAVDAKTAALQAKAAAELAASQAAAIVTPDGLAARVLALEGAPHFFFDNDGHLYFHYGSAGAS